MKTYIFLSNGGETIDGAGNDINNCQQIADVVSAENVSDAYNRLVKTGKFYGEFDTCFCYELANDGKVQGRFDLITENPLDTITDNAFDLENKNGN